MSLKNNIKNQMRPFSDTSVYDEKPPVATKPVAEEEATQDEEANNEGQDQEAIDCETVMNMPEASQLAIFEALKAKFDTGEEQETGADNSKF